MTFLVWPCHFLEFLPGHRNVCDWPIPSNWIGTTKLTAYYSDSFSKHCYLQVFCGVPDRIPHTHHTRHSHLGHLGHLGRSNRKGDIMKICAKVGECLAQFHRWGAWHLSILSISVVTDDRPKPWRILTVLLYMVCQGSHQYTPFMLAYIPAPWILWGNGGSSKFWCEFCPELEVRQSTTAEVSFQGSLWICWNSIIFVDSNWKSSGVSFYFFSLLPYRDSRGGMAEGSTMMLEPRTSSMTRMTETIDDPIGLGSNMSKNVTITSGQKQQLSVLNRVLWLFLIVFDDKQQLTEGMMNLYLFIWWVLQHKKRGTL